MNLEALVNNKILCKDIAMLSGEHQTFKLEAFHSLVNQFAPKMYVYSYSGMQCRYWLLGINTDIKYMHATVMNTRHDDHNDVSAITQFISHRTETCLLLCGAS